jgi:pimeloyl-ACP methyl ester carboxylesterase
MIEGYLDNGVYFRHNELVAGRPVLVFVHGFTGSSSAWAGYEEELGQKYNLVFFDWRGHGKSKKYSHCGDYRIENIVRDLADIFGALRVSEAIIISHSYGSLIAIDFYAKYPHLVRGLVFLAPDYRVGEALWIKLGHFLMSNMPVGLLKTRAGEYGAHLDYSRLPTGDWSFKRIFADIRNTTFQTYCCYFRQIDKFNAKEIVPGIIVPVLIIHGAKDTIFPAKNSSLMAKKIKNARLEIIPGANHILVLNNTAQIIEQIDIFVRDIPSA